jgi:Protein of unknown function (DUF2752)
MFENNRSVQMAWLVILLLTPLVLWVMPGNYFDNSEVFICPSKLLFDYECFGCGMTRAVQHMHHFQWEDALYFNYGVVVIYPALVLIWGLWVRHAWMRVKALSANNIGMTP